MQSAPFILLLLLCPAVASAQSNWDVDHERVCGKADEAVLALRVKSQRARAALTAEQRAAEIQPAHILALRADMETAARRANLCNSLNRQRRQRRIDEMPRRTREELVAIPPAFRLPEEEAAIQAGPAPQSATQGNRTVIHRANESRDLRRYQARLVGFDAAMQRRDPVGVRGALQEFVAQGRAEVAEVTRETAQAAHEANQSARGGRRDLNQQAQEQRQGEVILSELERMAATEISFGPQAGIVQRARGLMVRFTQLQRAELVP